MVRQFSRSSYILVTFALSIILLGTLQPSAAGPVDKICFEEECCLISSRDDTQNCSPGTIKCARDLTGRDMVGNTFSSEPVGSIKDCPPPPEEQRSSFKWNIQEMKEMKERLQLEAIVQLSIESERYDNCLRYPQGLVSVTALDKLRCQSLAPARFKIRNLLLENAELTKDNVRLKVTNSSLKQQVEDLETENKELKKLWELYLDWVKEMLEEKDGN